MRQLGVKTSVFAGMVLPVLLTACGGSGSSGSNNRAPQFSQSEYTFTVVEDESYKGSISASDADGDELSYSVSGAGTLGSLSISAGGSFTYQPNTNANGEDRVVVTASDGQASTAVTLIFSIEPTNDAPVLQSTRITVAAGSTYEGQLLVTDPDGDDITLALVQDVVNGALDLDLTTGKFTYTSSATEEVDDQFVISYTDGIVDPIEATITVAPSYASNADKQAYYYAWSGNHLAKALAALANIEDDTVAAEGKIKVARGYYLAALYAQGDEILSSIAPLNIRAEGYREAALVLDSHQHVEEANKRRAIATTLYNQYLAEKGIANLSSDDASFYQLTLNNYRAVDAVDEAAALQSILSVYADAIRQDEHTTAYGRLATAFSMAAGDGVERYTNNPNEENRASAKQLVDDYAVLADGIGYNVDDDYPEPYKYRTKAGYLTSAAYYYDVLSESYLAKEYLARALSYYTEVAYDSAFNREADPYAANTLDDYDYPLETLAGVFASQYPALETNVPADLIYQRNSADSSNVNAAKIIYMVEAANRILVDGTTVAAATAEAEAFFIAEEDLVSYLQLLMEDTADPALAFRVYSGGQMEAAEKILLKVRDLMISDAFAEQTRFTRLSTGNQGCDRLVQMYANWFGDASEMVAGCQTLVDKAFANDGTRDTDDLIDARLDLLHAYFQNRDYQDFTAAAANIYGEMITLTSYLEDPIDRLEYYATIASAMASFNRPTDAISAWVWAESEINALLADKTALTIDTLEDIVGELLDFAVSSDESVSGSAYAFREMYRVDTALRRGFSSLRAAEVAPELSVIRTSLAQLVSGISSSVAGFTANEQQGIREDLITLVQGAGLEDDAQTLAAEDVINAAGDHDALWLVLAEGFALQDGFPASNVANVDTDGDGLPNFFFTTATDEDISASNLIADDDSDNDGILDSADANPLEADN